MKDTLFKKVDYSLSKLIEDIDMGEIGLPEIQRPFVWNAAKVRDFRIKVDAPKAGREDRELSGTIMVSPEVTARLRKIAEVIRKKNAVLTFTNTRESSEVLSSRLRAALSAVFAWVVIVSNSSRRPLPSTRRSNQGSSTRPQAGCAWSLPWGARPTLAI